MSLASKAVRGAMWTIASSLGARIVGVLGTLIITRFLAPDVIGEVAAATVLVYTTNTLFHPGIGQYIIVRGKDGSEATFHGTFYHYLFGAVGLTLLYFVGDYFGPMFNAPNLGLYLPGMIVAMAIRRLGAVPDKVLVRNMQFRAVAIANALGEVVYTVCAVGLATQDYGGMSIVYANIAQSTIITLVVVRAAGFREWLTPCKITWARTRDLFRFGIPLGVESIAHVGAQYWDKLLYSRFFGAGMMGMYNLGYNLAAIPGAHIGEHIGTVLLPSIAKLPPERRPAAVIRSTALLAILIFPLAVGLAAVSESLIDLVLNDEWQGVAPLLTALSVISIFRPVSWVLGSYMVAQERTGIFMWLELGKIALLLACIPLFAPLGPVWACAGVGIAFGGHAIGGVILVMRADNISATQFLPGFVGPLVACVPLVGAVLGARWLVAAAGVSHPAISLCAEIAAGAVVYVPAAFVFAPGTARDFVGLVKNALRGR